jgi:hypothetical protein
MEKLDFSLLQQEIDYVVVNRTFEEAFESYNLVKEWVESSGVKEADIKSYNLYQNYLIKLKFLALNFFDIDEYPELFRNSASLAFEITDYNLWEKIETELIAMNDINARDEFKKKLKTALEQCSNSLTSSSQPGNPKKVAEWIKDFVINLGLDKFDKLKKAEYLSNSQSIKNLSNVDKNKVRDLLDIYEKLGLSSKEKEGYENSVLMNIDGRPIIFHRGEVEEVRPIDIQGKEPDEINDILNPSSSSPGNMTQAPIVEKLIQPVAQKPITPRTVEMEEILNSYSPSSLEYKAISQEILRLQKAEARKDAKR